MAGFAIVMAFLTYSFVGLMVAGVLSFSLYRYAIRRRNSTAAVKLATVPFLALFWLPLALLMHMEVSNRLAHQDCGFSPDPYVTLPNGYTLGSLNTYDGYFKAPGFETDVPVAGPGYVRSIVTLQLSDGYFTGTQFDFKTSRVRSFIFNTATRSFETPDTDNATGQVCDSTDPRCIEEWERADTTAQAGANSYWQIYYRYRHRWPDYVLILLIAAGEGAIVFWARRVWLQPDSLQNA